MTQLSELDPHAEAFKSIFVSMAKDIKVLQDFFQKRAQLSEKYRDAQIRAASQFTRMLLSLNAVYPNEVPKPKTTIPHAMGNDMATLALSLNLILEGMQELEAGMNKTSRLTLTKDLEYASYKNAVFGAAQKFTQELIRAGIDIDDLTQNHFHALREALSYVSPATRPPQK